MNASSQRTSLDVPQYFEVPIRSSQDGLLFSPIVESFDPASVLEKCNKCKIRAFEPVTPLPKLQLLLICWLSTSASFSNLYLFSFINPMIVELGIVESASKTGFWSGSVESVFALARLLVMKTWVGLSETKGRRWVALVGVSGCGIATALFGFSQTYWQMILLRFLSGASGGIQTVSKAMVAEITDVTNEASAFALLGCSWNFASSAAPIMGGFLTHLPDKIPLLAQSQFLQDYPYSVPALAAGIIPSLAVIPSIFWLKETLQPSLPGDQKSGRPPLSDIMVWPLIHRILCWCFQCFLSSSFFAMFVLFTFTPVENGGLGLTPSQTGTCLSVNAVSTILLELSCFPPLKIRFGALKIQQAAVWFYVPVFLLLPAVQPFAVIENSDSIRWALWTSLFGVMMLLQCGQFVFLTGDILVNNAAPSRRHLTTLNAASSFMGTLGVTVAPVFSSTLFAYSLEHSSKFIWFMYSILAFLMGIWFNLAKPVTGWRDMEMI